MSYEFSIIGKKRLFKFIKQFIILNSSFIIFLSSCSVSKQIAKSAKEEVLGNKALLAAHVGISIYDPADNKYLYNYQGDKYFVPASNTKIPTCYAAMKYLGDSLVGFMIREVSDTIWLKPCGDPTFLNSEFTNQRIFNYLKGTSKNIYVVFHSKDEIQEYGSGWSWNDYEEAYMAERSAMPVYANVISFEIKDNRLLVIPPILKRPFFNEPMIQLMGLGDKFSVIRDKDENKFRFWSATTSFSKDRIPFKTKNGITNFDFLRDTLNRSKDKLGFGLSLQFDEYKKNHSQPTDSLLKPMMHRSDNFFAEQSLLMVSNEKLGVMNDAKIIDTILKTDFKDLPQKPRWADGSGLSRYNLFTPQSFVAILNKMKNEFGMERIKVIFPTGGEGTISSYYKADSGYIYAKTGTLSGVVAFSGYLYTRRGKLLIFSTLINNHQSSSTDIRRAIEKFLQGIRNKY